jgi:hypothetical protein
MGSITRLGVWSLENWSIAIIQACVACLGGLGISTSQSPFPALTTGFGLNGITYDTLKSFDMGNKKRDYQVKSN